MATKKVPRGALRILQIGEGCTALAEFFGEGKEKKPKMKMVAYGGGIIKDHWYWNNLILDLQGVQFDKKFPILENHSTDRKVAFSSNPILENGKLEINPDKTQFVETEISAEFQRLSSGGFPYQCSVYASPSVVERISEGASAKANGITLKGPGTIFRKWKMKEASVCVFGWDSETNATAFSKEEVEIDMEETILFKEKPKLIKRNKLTEEGGDTMDSKELFEKYPELAKEVQLQAVKDKDIEIAKKETEFSKERAGLETEIKGLKTTTLALEKKDDIRTQNELKASADNIWTKQLSDSNIPENMHDKVCRYVSYDKFTKDDVLDVEAFGEAIKAEIKDWEARGVTSTNVLGAGFTEQNVDEAEKELSAEDKKGVDDDVNKLRKKVGADPLKSDE